MPKINRRNFIQYTSLASSSLLVPSAWASEKPGIAENGGRADADFEQLTYPSYNLNTIGFTKANSWLMLIKRENQLLFKTIDHDVISEKWMPYWAGDMFRITFYEDGKPVDFEFDTSPWQLDVKVGSNKVSFTFADDQTILMQGAGVDFKCEMQQAIAWQYDLPQRKTVMVAQAKRSIEMKFEKNKIVAAGQRPKTELEDFKLASPGEEVKMAFRIVKVDGHWDEPLPSFDTSVNRLRKEVESWMSRMPEVPEYLLNTAKTAWYYLWHAQHDPTGNYNYRLMFSSKNTWLTKIWAWDNCFHGLAVASADLEMAWNQMFTFFDHQYDNGCLPEPMSSIQKWSGWVKPPVYGWTILKLIEWAGEEACKPYIERAYSPVQRLTSWWLGYRDFNNNGIASYLHGNDSGWDNASAFDQGTPLESPDLSAHLIKQMEALEKMARILGKTKEADDWQNKGQELLDKMLDHLVEDDLFIGKKSDGTVVPSQSLLYYIPILLGDRLPKSIRKQMVKNLGDPEQFLTDYGLATEAVNSPEHKEDGYWRGPIWGPSTYLVFDGLISAGENKLAKMVAERYCKMCKQDPGMWENYDATTGKGRQGPAVTWTSAVFILFAGWLAKSQ